ncbi:MAG: anhydro-N-acetylmuramic acid kinase [Bryobacterales bacterium]|nr:anhydro-N-acetylmuramic acid kinase [Bryobacterales bacterium]
MRVAGIMSGTSLDGIDVAIVDIGRRIVPVAWASTPYPKAVREAILAVSNRLCHTAEISRLNFLLPELYAAALQRLCTKAGVPVESVELIGCHGQTIFHEGAGGPVAGRRVKSTLQIGDGSVLAELTGVPVVSDLRTRDMAAGGQGAPLVPYFDYAYFRHPKRSRVAVNIGGIANLTYIAPGARPEDVVAFDTGPGNMVMDQLVTAHTQGQATFDAGGRIASRGKGDLALVEKLLRARYYRQAPPKSAGREEYGEEFVKLFAGLAFEDAVATATAFTVATLVRGIGQVCAAPDDVIVGGGGVRNAQIMGQLAAQLPASRVTSTAEYGIDADAKEAIAFALMAHATWRRQPGNIPTATGARRAVILGKISF